MADRLCSKCGKLFAKPAHLRRHEARKTPCAPILEETDLSPETLEDPDFAKKTCRFCRRVFSSYDSMRRHVRNNCKIAPNAKNGDAGMERLYEHTIRRQQAQIDDLRRQNQEMLGMIQHLVTQSVSHSSTTAAPTVQKGTSVSIRGDNNVNTVDARKVTIVVNVFGREKLDHVTATRIRAILDESLMRPALPEAAQAAVLKMAMIVYSDPDHPENLTAYLPNKKTNDVLVHMSRDGTKAGWEVQPASLILPPMAQKSVDILFDRQLYEDAADYGPLMKELAENEKRYTAGAELRPILVRNKELLARALQTLPVAGRALGEMSAERPAEPARRED